MEVGQVDPRADGSGGGPVKRLSLPQAIRDDRGSVMVVVALAMTALLSMIALAVDIGMLFSARGEAQRVADAAALAGAGSFMQTWNGPAAEEAARSVAIEYGTLNTVRDEGVVILPEDVEIDMATHRVTVTVRRNADARKRDRDVVRPGLRCRRSGRGRAGDRGGRACGSGDLLEALHAAGRLGRRRRRRGIRPG